LETISDKEEGGKKWATDLDRALAFAKEMSDRAREIFMQEGTVEPVSFLVMPVNPMTGEPFEDGQQAAICCSPGQFGIPSFDPNSRTLYCDLLRVLAQKTKATAVVMIQEIWIWKADKENAQMPHGSLEFVPGRQEAVSMMFEHQQLGVKSMMWLAEITRDKDGKGTLGEFTEMPTPDKAEGRFVGILPRKEAFKC